jgi:hypothetical protein
MSRRNTITERDTGYAAVVKQIDRADKSWFDVGWWGTRTYGTDNQATTPYIATIHEFGTRDGRIPERPFLRPTAQEKDRELRDMLHQGAVQIVFERKKVESVLAACGDRAAGWVQAKINSIFQPELRPSTLARRRHGGAKPLIDTAWMRNSCGVRVVVGGSQVSEKRGG